jgi:ubiquinone biosynthesis protein
LSKPSSTRKTAKPVLERWVDQQIGIRGFIDRLKVEAPLWSKLVPTIPRLFAQWLESNNKQGNTSDHQLILKLMMEQQKTKKLVWGSILFMGGLLGGTLFTLNWLS